MSRSNRKKALKNIAKTNSANRNLSYLGATCADILLPEYQPVGKLCISGGSEAVRHDLIVQICRQTLSLGVPTIVLHEGKHHLENRIASVCRGQSRYFRTINASQPYYEPIYRLSDFELSRLITSAALPEDKIDAAGAVYISAMAKLLRKKGIVPYTRIMASCPHNQLDTVIDNAVRAGNLTSDAASAIRNDLALGASARASVELLLNQLVGEGDIICEGQHLSRSTSIMECVKAGGVLMIDIATDDSKHAERRTPYEEKP